MYIAQTKAILIIQECNSYALILSWFIKKTYKHLKDLPEYYLSASLLTARTLRSEMIALQFVHMLVGRNFSYAGGTSSTVYVYAMVLLHISQYVKYFLEFLIRVGIMINSS